MTTLYKAVLIETAEQAEALPIGTVAIGPARLDPLLPMVRTGRYPGRTWHSDYTGAVCAREVINWTALVRIEAEEETTGALVNRAGDIHWEESRRLVTPWESV